MSEAARFEASDAEGRRMLRVSGVLDTAAAAALWRPLLEAARGRSLLLDARGVTTLDSAGAVLLLEASRAGRDTHTEPPDAAAPRAVLARMRTALDSAPPQPAPPEVGPITGLGLAVLGAVRDGLSRVVFLGEATLGTVAMLLRPWRLRLREVLRHLDEAGTRAIGLCVLLGALLGMILAFQSAIPMRRYGAEVFIPQIVGVSLIRELGALIAAIILAGRSGSAFAAELGTMRVNEEVDALTTMGVDPVQWLVLPRLIAATLVMPALAMVVNIAGIIGMGLVMGTLGLPASRVAASLQDWISLTDLFGGLFKAAVFGLAIGLIGCRAGLAAGGGPRAVGDAATAAVVGSIVTVVVLDGLFAVLFFRLGW
jgi:phospholipid/cholesterol/gamma-HCH transport system permease protein